MANVLVTGGTGLIGGPTVRRLVSLGHKAVAYDLSPNMDNLGDAKEDVEVVRGDIADMMQLMRVIKNHKIDRVIHLAASIKHQSIADPHSAVMANCAATSYLCELGLALGVERMVWASTAGVYGRRPQYPEGARVNEDDLLGPTDPYGATKVACEQITRIYRDHQGFDVVGFRLGYVYGLGRLTGATGEFNLMLHKLAMGQSATFPALSGGLSSLWQPMFNEDMAEVFCDAALGPRATSSIYNLPVNETLSVEDSIGILKELVPGAEITLAEVSGTIAPIPLLDGTRAQKMYGVKLKYPLREGWAKMLRHYQNKL